YQSIYDFRDFYNTPMGGVVRSVLRRKIRSCWPHVKGLRVVGIGCPQPYLDMFLPEAERCIAINPAAQGSFPWPEQGANLSVLAEEAELPIETNSVDRVLLIHSLEYGELPHSNLKEIYRILKPGGSAYIGCGFGAGYAHIDRDRESRKGKPPKKFTHDEILEALEGAGIEDFTVIDDNLRGYWVIIRKHR
ncbi:MAG: methyltransferase domain-containing protein, partial [Spirochaetes bacterium]|nr:methyltransferase domain-containing protein [Spirochaetota bacterium]